jgi:integrase
MQEIRRFKPSFALVAMLGLLGLRISEATRANISDLGEEDGHRGLRVCGKGTQGVLIARAVGPGNAHSGERVRRSRRAHPG